MAKPRRSAKAHKKQSGGRNADLEAIAMIKASGILNPDATLEQILKVTRELDAAVGASPGGTIFVYQGFVYSPCV